MKRSDLESLGLSKENIDAIMALHGKDIETHKAQLQDVQTNLDNLTAQMTEANKTIEGFKTLDIDGMKKSVGEWETKYAQLQQESAEKLAKTHFDYDLDTALRAAKAKNTKAVRALLDESKLKHDAEKHSFEGLEEQLNNLREKESYQFDTDDGQEKPEFTTGSTSTTVVGDAVVNAAMRGAGLDK